jgi:homoserine O-succinyltransferase
VKVGLVNNMPDSAFDETEQQFLRLLASGMPAIGVGIRRYWMPGIQRDARTRRKIRRNYRPIDALYADPPDALVVTGTEPRHADLRDEPYWEPLSSLLQWAERHVPATLLSCLASHGALLTIDGIDRRPLAAKLHGVFRQQPRAAHRLVEGLGTAAFPHSRLNDVPTELLRAHGYAVLVDSPRSGWTVATREREGRLLVLLQGHPEYAPTALLREYRRDVRRFLDGTALTYPSIPVGYLDPEGVALLEQFRQQNQAASASDLPEFPFDAAAAHIAVDWQHDSRRLFGNWLAEATHRAARLETQPGTHESISRRSSA